MRDNQLDNTSAARFVPDAVVGDFDSLRKDARDFYESAVSLLLAIATCTRLTILSRAPAL